MAMDYEQLAVLTKPQIQAQIVALGADYHVMESKRDLIGRLLQLQGTAQPIDKIRKELAAHGIGEDGEKSLPMKMPQHNHRLTEDEIRKALAKFIAKGLEVRISKDGENWMMRLKCEQATQDGKIYKATRIDSGNTMIPIRAIMRAAETITTVSTVRRKQVTEDAFDHQYDALDGDATSAA